MLVIEHVFPLADSKKVSVQDLFKIVCTLDAKLTASSKLQNFLPACAVNTLPKLNLVPTFMLSQSHFEEISTSSSVPGCYREKW